MELTRLKRYMRDNAHSPVYVQALTLLDVLDQVREAADEYEDCLRQGDAPTERGITDLLSDAADQLVEALVAMPSVGVSGILDRLLAEARYEHLLAELMACKTRSDEAAAQHDDELGYLDEDPF